MSMKEVKIADNELGAELQEVLKRHNIKAYMLTGYDEDAVGVAMFNFESTPDALTCLTMLFNAMPELFAMLFGSAMESHLEKLRSIYEGVSVPGKQMDCACSGCEAKMKKVDKVGMSDYVKEVKF